MEQNATTTRRALASARPSDFVDALVSAPRRVRGAMAVGAAGAAGVRWPRVDNRRHGVRLT